MRSLRRDEYTVGWICALHVELTAAIAMLDEEHEPLPREGKDTNTYALGRIGKHNVVLAGLPSGETGKVSAAIVATRLDNTFPSIRCVMMVGIAGAAPSHDNDIRLGDIVVGVPGPKNSGVVQYDFGKTVGEKVFKQTGALSAPPASILTAITHVRARHSLSQYGYIRHLQHLPDNLDPTFVRPEIDVQFLPEYDHHPADAPTCEECEEKMQKPLGPRSFPLPRVFYGTIASADQVMRHGGTRDRIAHQCGALCFEMEAAGLANDFPCVVIRGMCDYADSHKNKQWQPYAAISAAAYAKELLETIASEDVSHELPVSSRPMAGSTAVDSAMVPTHSPISSWETHWPVRSSTDTTVVTEPTDKSVGNFYSHLNTKVLSSGSVALGRLVKDRSIPWDHYAPSPRPGEDQIGISLQYSFRDSLKEESERQSEDLVKRFASILNIKTTDPSQALEQAVEKTYVLHNADEWLRVACADQRTRSWIENIIKKTRYIFMVVGILTASNFPVSTDETIVGVLYRKIVFNWLWSRYVDEARFASEPNIWQPSFIPRTSKDQDVKLLEVSFDSAEGDKQLPKLQLLNDI